MRRLVTVAVALIIVALAGCAGMPPASELAEVVPSQRLEIAVESGDTLAVEIPFGEVSIQGHELATVNTEMVIKCPRDSSRCEKWAAKAKLESRRNGNELWVGLPRRARTGIDVSIAMQVPRDHALAVLMGYGELRVRDMQHDVSIKLKAGEVDIVMPADAVAQARLSARFGDATLHIGDDSQEGRRPLLVGAKVDWQEGAGAHTVDANVRYGDVRLMLYR